MIERLLNFADFFISGTIVDSDQKVRSRMFVVLLIFAILLKCFVLINLTAQGLGASEFAKANAWVIAIEFLFLVAMKFSKNPEWPCFILFAWIVFALFYHAVTSATSLLQANFQVLPLVIVFGFFCLESTFKRIALFAITLVGSVAAVIFIPMDSQPVLGPLVAPNVGNEIMLTTVYQTALTLFCMAWYVYVKNLAEEEFVRDVQIRTQNVRLGEISTSLRSLIPELREPLKRLEQNIGDHISTRTLPRSDEMLTIEAAILQMTKITQSIGWVYRAYRTESVASTGSVHFQEQLALLLKGKLHGTPWSLRLKPQTEDHALAGPMPTVILLILTIVDHLVQTRSQDYTRTLEVEIDCGVNEVVCLLSWKDKDGELNLGPTVSPVMNLDLDFRLELIAELVQACQAKLEHAHENFANTIKVSGYWRKR